jgi:hypothetical protein
MDKEKLKKLADRLEAAPPTGEEAKLLAEELRSAAEEELGAIGVKHTEVDKDGAWDAGANLKRLGDSPTAAQLRAMHAWVDPKGDATAKSSYKLPHHNVGEDGKVGAANLKAVESAMGRLNGGGLDIPQADRAGVHAHLAAHYKDAGMKAPDLKASANLNLRHAEQFGAAGDDYKATEFKSSTADPKTGTIDCVWYGGQPVVRRDPDTGDPYMLTLDMAGCRMERLNSGAPVFDTHFSGDDFKSLIAGKVGTNAQVGVVKKAWADGKKGMATLQFDMDKPEGAEMFRKAASGQVRNLSHGTWIYNREKTSAAAPGAQVTQEGAPPYSNPNEMGMFTATDWEPFEISPCTVPADFSTQFLTAGGGETQRTQEVRQDKETNMDEKVLAAARDESAANAVKAERQRVADIGTMAAPFKMKAEFTAKLISDGLSVDDARKSIMTELAAAAQKDANGRPFEIRGEVVPGGQDAQETKLAQMQSAMLLRSNPKLFLSKDHRGVAYLNGCGEDVQRKHEDMAREYRGFSLLEMAREYLSLRGISHRGMNKMQIAELALRGNGTRIETFGAESTSDFPAILANVANKTLRMAYEAYPRTFQALAKQVTAADFKPINRVQLSDAPALQQINEKGEFHRANLTDSNQNYSLATFGEIVALTRKVIINDDLQAFTRVPAVLGVAAAQLESNTVWAVITANQVMQQDNVALFNSAHNNLQTGAGTSIITAALGALAIGRQYLRLQKGPQGTYLNLVPRFIVVPAALENYMLQAVYPANIASTDVTKVVPEWVRSLVPVVEPRLDANSEIIWYLFADPAQIDTLEYCYLEGQEGVYIETRQGFDVDGVEIKARLDFAAQAIDYRGMQYMAGA